MEDQDDQEDIDDDGSAWEIKSSETELEDEYGRYIYQIELRDPQGVQWDLELDASTGEILKNHQDD